MTPVWRSLIRVFSALAGVVKHADPDGLDVVFATSLDRYHGGKRKTLTPEIQKRKPSGACDMKEAIQDVVDRFWRELETSQEKRWSRELFGRFTTRSSNPPKVKRGLSIYVLTDGVWQGTDGPSPVCGVDEAIRHIVKKLHENKYLDCKVGIQFIRFGNVPVGIDRLRILDSGLKGAPYNIDMWVVYQTVVFLPI